MNFKGFVFCLAILLSASGLMEMAIAQSGNNLLRNAQYESYINLVHQGQARSIESLSEEEKVRLAQAHFQRAMTLENIYELTLHTSIDLLEKMTEESGDQSAEGVIERLNARKQAYYQLQPVNSNGLSSSNPLEIFLINWHVKGFINGPCNSVTGAAAVRKGCETIQLLYENDAANYSSVIQRLVEKGNKSRELLANEIASKQTLEEKGELLVNWLNELHIHFISDYVVSGWMFETLNNSNADLSFFFSGLWNSFPNEITSPANPIELYRYLGSITKSNGVCSHELLENGILLELQQNSEFLLRAPTAMARCAPQQNISQKFSESLSLMDSNSRIFQIVSQALLAIGNYELALDHLTEAIPRSQINSLRQATPWALSILVTARYFAGGSENWRESRQRLLTLEREFTLLPASALVLQLATEPERRESINIYIE